MQKRVIDIVRTRTWILITAAILVIAAAALLWIALHRTSNTVANIYLDGVCIRSVDLSAVTQEETFTVESGGGVNVIHVAPGRICVESADCPDQICVHQGWISNSAAPIVCLPHRLVIRIEGGPSDIDSVAR